MASTYTQAMKQTAWDLDNLSNAKRLIKFTADEFDSLKGKDVLEIGAGIGTFTKEILKRGAKKVTALEPDPNAFSHLEETFKTDPKTAVDNRVLSDFLKNNDKKFDVLICQNVLEHIEDDQLALDGMYKILKPEGRLFLLTPANQFLFNSLDQAYGHYRRYDKLRLQSLALNAGFQDINVQPFNCLGIIGWFFKGLFNLKEIDQNSIKLYEFLLMFWGPIEKRTRPPIGLSLILRAKR